MKVPFVHILPLFTIFAEAYAANFDLEAIAGIGAEKRMLQEGGITSTICSSDTPCPTGEFCGYQQDDTGSCLTCSEIGNHLLFCTFYDELFYDEFFSNPAATQDCAEKCFSPCNRGATFDATSGGLELSCDERSFCNRALDPSSDVGYCDSCSKIGGVENCKGAADPASVAECAAVCLGECNANEPCNEGSFCSIDKDDDAGNGYCVSCGNFALLAPTPSSFCFNDIFNLAEESQRLCAEICYGTCSIDGMECSSITRDGAKSSTYCNSQEGDIGYCNVCPFEQSGCADIKDPQVQANCIETCFDVCGPDVECPIDPNVDIAEGQNMFCDYQMGSTGACNPCWNKFTPEDCADVEDPQGQSSCIETCFDVCGPTVECPIDSNTISNMFCDYRMGSTGACNSCWNMFAPEDCFDDNHNLSPVAQASCNSTCFAYCDKDEDCPGNENLRNFCNTDLGYCFYAFAPSSASVKSMSNLLFAAMIVSFVIPVPVYNAF